MQWTKKSDVWSLGCLLYKLSVCEYPYEGIRTEEGMRIAMSGGNTIDFSAIEDPVLRDCVKRCLQKIADRRIDLDGLLSHPFVRSENFADHHHHPEPERTGIFGPEAPELLRLVSSLRIGGRLPDDYTVNENTADTVSLFRDTVAFLLEKLRSGEPISSRRLSE